MKNKSYHVDRGVLFALLVFLAAFLLFQLQYQVDNKYTAGPPYGKDGRFAFSEQQMEQNTPLFLIDGWKLYPDEFLTPDQLSGAPAPKEVFIGQYPNFSYLSPGHLPFGEATYRLMLCYEGSLKILMLEIPEIFTEYTLWMDGQEMNTSSGSVVFEASGDTELVLAVRNHSHYYSGLTYPPALGTPETVSRMLLIRHLFYSVLCLIPLALCLYAAAAWLARERDSRFLHFGLLCFFFAIHCIYPFLHQFGITGTLWYAIEDSTWMAVLSEMVTLSTLQAGMGDTRWYRKVVRPFCLAACLLCLVSVFFILPNFDGLINLYGSLLDGYKFLCWLYLLFCAVRAIAAKQQGGYLILTGGAVFGAGMMVNLLDNNRFEPIYTGWQTEYAGFFMVIVFWVLTVQHSKQLLQQNRKLTAHLEEEVQHRTAELHAVLEERKAFFSDLAHNLKAPMAAIQGFTDLIMQGNLYLDVELRGHLGKINNANAELSRRMQVFSELNAFDKLTEPLQLLDVDELLSQVYTDNEPEAAISGVLLRVDPLQLPVRIYAQRQKLLLLFENLIYNALSFTPEDGRITLIPRLEEHWLIIEVTDTGCGIAPEHLPHLFERFYVARENREGGTGLGLYIAQITAEELGGSISVRSTLGKGTVFTIRLPTTHSETTI